MLIKWFPQKTSIIYWNYIKNTNIYESLIKIEWPVDFRKDPHLEWRVGWKASWNVRCIYMYKYAIINACFCGRVYFKITINCSCQ